MFYRDSVLQQLKSGPSNSKKDMVEILRRTADDEVDGSPESDSRFDGIDLDDVSAEGITELLSRLTTQERKEFEEMVSSGRITSLIPKEDREEAWWLHFKPKLVSDDADPSSSGLGPNRDLVNRIPALTAISKQEASPDLKYCLLNLFISYCYTFRLFNGDRSSCPDDFLDEIRLRSAVVGEEAVFRDTATALVHCTQNLLGEKLVSQEFVQQLLEDVKLIASDKNASLELLSDLWFVIRDCLTIKAKRKENKLLQKKIEYFISWTRDRYEEYLPAIRSDMELLMLEARSRSGKASN